MNINITNKIDNVIDYFEEKEKYHTYYPYILENIISKYEAYNIDKYYYDPIFPKVNITKRGNILFVIMKTDKSNKIIYKYNLFIVLEKNKNISIHHWFMEDESEEIIFKLKHKTEKISITDNNLIKKIDNIYELLNDKLEFAQLK